MKFTTKLLHGNVGPNAETGATTPPIYQSAAFNHQSAYEMEKIFSGKKPGFVYTRVNNPTIDYFERRMTLLEGGVGSAACSSGMAAISLAVLNIVQNGDEIVSGSGIFGGTYSFFNGLSAYGVKTIYAKENTADCFEKCITDNTRLIFLETIGNPKLDVPDIEAFARLAHEYNIPLMIDNTAATPYLIQPLKHGADIVVHSVSKFINGGGNSIGGIIIDSGHFKWNKEKFAHFGDFAKFGPFCYLAKLRAGLFKDIGSCMAPFNAYLTNIGLDTLSLRMERVCSNADKLAKYLLTCDKIKAVNYPGLPDNPDHEIAKRQFADKYGAILTIRIGTKEKAFALIDNLQYALNAANIGDTKTLVIHPASTIYAADSDEQKMNAGVYDDLIRICVGLEDIEDIEADFKQALSKI